VLVFDGGTMGKMAKNSPYSGMVMVQYGAIWWPQDPKLWNWVIQKHCANYKDVQTHTHAHMCACVCMHASLVTTWNLLAIKYDWNPTHYVGRLTSIRNVQPSRLRSRRLEFLARDWHTSWVGPSSRMSRCEPKSSSWIDVLSASPRITGSTSPKRVPPSSRNASRHNERLTVSPVPHPSVCPIWNLCSLRKLN